MNISVNSNYQKNALKDAVLSQWTSNVQDKRSIAIFLFLAIFFTVIGVFLAVYRARVDEYSFQYSDDPECRRGFNCTIQLNITKDLEAPVYFYYELTDFYQNHKQYVVSSRMARFYDKDDDAFDETACYPYELNKDIGFNLSITGEPLNPNASAIPCGVAAASYFNDSYVMLDPRENSIILNDTGITWESHYKGMVYKEIDPRRQWTNLTADRFINWVRLASLSKFRKVWARIDQNLAAGIYTILVTNNWNNDEYKADISVVVGTVNGLGNENTLLTVCYLTFAGISWIAVIAFIVRIIRNKRFKKYQ